MSARLNPYLNFRGEAADAMAFYQSVLGGELTSSTFAEYGGMGSPRRSRARSCTPARRLRRHRADGGRRPQHPPRQLRQRPHQHQRRRRRHHPRLVRALAEGGTVDVPFEQAPWGDHFGQVKDKFGVNWLFNASGGRPADGGLGRPRRSRSSAGSAETTPPRARRRPCGRWSRDGRWATSSTSVRDAGRGAP